MATLCHHAAIFNFGCGLHPLTKLALPHVRVKVAADCQACPLQEPSCGQQHVAHLEGAPSKERCQIAHPGQLAYILWPSRLVHFSEAD